MIFNSIYLSIDPIENGKDFTYDFKLKSRWLCAYIERRIKKEKIRTDGFNRISIRAADQHREPHVNSCHVLCVTLPFEKERFLKLETKEDFALFYIDMLRKGIAIGSSFTHLPAEKIKEAISDFEKSDYSNRWIQKRRLHRKTMTYGQIECSMTMEALTVHLTLERKKEEIYRKEILTIDPDENIYWHRYKDIVFDENQVTVTSKSSTPLFTANLDELITQPDVAHNSGGCAPSA